MKPSWNVGKLNLEKLKEQRERNYERFNTKRGKSTREDMLIQEKLRSRNISPVREYSPLVDPRKPASKSPTIGISHKYVRTKDDSSRSLARVMPTYGLYDNAVTMKSPRNVMEPTTEDIDNEL